MANTSIVYVKINSQLKNDVDKILENLGISPSLLIQMLYIQIKLTKRIPFEIKLPKSIDELTREDLNYELLKGFNDIESGKVKTSNEVDEIINELEKLKIYEEIIEGLVDVEEGKTIDGPKALMKLKEKYSLNN